MREQELQIKEQRLIEREQNFYGEHAKPNAGQHRMKELAAQLQTRHEEVTRQRQDLEDRQRKCDDYEARLRSWEEQLEHVTNLLQGNGNGSRQRQVHHDDVDSLQ